MSDDTIDAIWFVLTFLLLVVADAGAFLSFIWLVSVSVSGVGLMPWLVIFPISLSVAFWAAWRLEP